MPWPVTCTRTRAEESVLRHVTRTHTRIKRAHPALRARTIKVGGAGLVVGLVGGARGRVWVELDRRGEELHGRGGGAENGRQV